MGLRSPWTGTTAARKCRRRPGTTRSRQPGATVLDVRNTYESDAGTFEGAVPLNTSTFVESGRSSTKRSRTGRATNRCTCFVLVVSAV